MYNVLTILLYHNIFSRGSLRPPSYLNLKRLWKADLEGYIVSRNILKKGYAVFVFQYFGKEIFIYVHNFESVFWAQGVNLKL